MNKKTFLAIFAILSLLGVFYVTGDDVPLGAQLTWVRSSTINYSNYQRMSHNAIAGNVTELDIYGVSQTKHWQGYFGEVTGLLTLDDAQNWTMYDWPMDNPTGEVYATLNSTTPDWASISCMRNDGPANHSTSPNTIRYWEIQFNMTSNAYDGINETFNMSQHPTFSVGAQTISQNNCSSTYTHVKDSWQVDKFVEVLLTENTGQLIFTTIIENDDIISGGLRNYTDVTGFDNETHDYQMIVAEDGTSLSAGQRNRATTAYYFYIDLE